MKTPNINKHLRQNPRSSRYGAPLGSDSYLDAPEVPLYVQRVHFIDGDYAPDGTYWGGGRGSEALYCGWSPEAENQVYVRAVNRADALRAIKDDFPEATFVKH